MINPKRLLPLPAQKTQNRHRQHLFYNARRLIHRGLRATCKRIEALQIKSLTAFQQLLETAQPPDISDLMKMVDQSQTKVTSALGNLLSGGPTQQQGTLASPMEDEKFLVYQIEVVGAEGELKSIAEEALTIRPNFSYTLKEINSDLRKVLDTGYFSSCQAKPEDTRDGMVLRINVEPNPKVTRIISTGGSVLPQVVFEEAVTGLLGSTLNNNAFEAAVRKINQWYISEGVFGEVCDASFEEPNVPTLKIVEATVNRIELRYLDAKTGDIKEEGGVKPEVIMRHMGSKVGSVVNNRQAQRDVEAIFGTGLFADVKLLINVSPESTSEAPKLDFLLDIYEHRRTGGLGLGAGWSAQTVTDGALPAFVGNIEYMEKNALNLGQRLVARMEFGHVDKLFKIEYNEPWIIGDKSRTSRTFAFMNNRTSGNPFYGLIENGTGIERFKTVIGRLMGSLTMSRPLSENWSATLGVAAQRITLMDDNSRAIRQDFTRAPVNVSGGLHDLMLAPFFKAVFTGWSNSQVLFFAEKAIPLRQDWLSIAKCSVRADKIFRLGPISLVFCGKGGAILGKVPPYEAFPLGGMHSIRGYREGSVGTATHFLEGTAEVRIPLVSNLQGTLFCDYGTDLNSGLDVIGNPGNTRNKPGKGGGVGFGVRVDSPIGPLRLEWAWNDRGSRLFHAGFGDHR